MYWIREIIQTKYVKKKKEEVSPALKLAWMHQLEDSKTIYKIIREKLISTTRNSTDNIRINRTTISKKQKVEKKNGFDISNEKRTSDQTGKPGDG